MSKISQERIERIKEEILKALYETYPEFKYTYQVSDFVLRDDEFTLNLLKELKKLMERAIRKFEYEKALVYKEQIRKLKNNL
jgi:excinuclease UvrABC helicase subunit UvrB